MITVYIGNVPIQVLFVIWVFYLGVVDALQLHGILTLVVIEQYEDWTPDIMLKRSGYLYPCHIILVNA